MPLLGFVEPPTDIFIVPTDIVRFASWLKVYLRAVLGGINERLDYDMFVLRQIHELETENGGLLIDVDAAGIVTYSGPNLEESSDIDEFPHYISFLLLDLDSHRTEVWGRYTGKVSYFDYQLIIRGIEDRWEGSRRESQYGLEWPALVDTRQAVQRSPVFHREPTEARTKTRPPGRHRLPIDEWARREVHWNGKPRYRVYRQWLAGMDAERRNALADPKDSFNKMLRLHPHGGLEVHKREQMDDTA